VLFTVADTADSQGNHLPQVMAINLGYGDVKAVTHPAGNRLQYMPFTLKGAVFRQAETNLTYTDIHSPLDHTSLSSQVQLSIYCRLYPATSAVLAAEYEAWQSLYG